MQLPLGSIRVGCVSVACAVLTFCAPPLTIAAETAESQPSGVYVNNPLHPEECDSAQQEAARQLRENPGSAYWQRVEAEALLCSGLAADDPVALDEAAVRFRELVRGNSGDVHVVIGLADAVRRRYPASAEAATTLEQALAVVRPEARDLHGYLAANLASVRLSQAACTQSVRTRPVQSYADVCIQESAFRIAEALELLGADPLRQTDPAQWLVQEGELLRWSGQLAASARRFRSALQLPGLDERRRESITIRLRQTEALMSRHRSGLDW